MEMAKLDILLADSHYALAGAGDDDSHIYHLQVAWLDRHAFTVDSSLFFRERIQHLSFTAVFHDASPGAFGCGKNGWLFGFRDILAHPYASFETGVGYRGTFHIHRLMERLSGSIALPK